MDNSKPTNNQPKQSAKQTAQKAQAGGPTISGVAGVGKQKTVTRPNSARRPSIVRGHTTKPSASGIGEGKENEFMANRQLHNTVRGKIQHKLDPKNKGGGDDYFSYQAKKTTAIKEDGGVAMSVGSGAAVPSIKDATSNFAFQVKKKIKDKLVRRKKPVEMK